MSERLTLGSCAVDLEAKLVQTDLGQHTLTESEARLLGYLSEHRGRTISRDELLQKAWGYAPGVRSRTLDTTIGRLRIKLERDPAEPVYLHTVRGQGYRLDVPDTPSAERPSRRAAPIPRLQSLFGRELALGTIWARLQSGARIVTLTGPSGIGKTWLARRVATELGDAGKREVWFADTSGLRDAHEMFAAIAEALSLPPRPRPLEALVARLSEEPSVGVIDDAQDLDDGALAALSDLLRRTRGTSVVVTSQRLLSLEGEHRVEVEPLDKRASAAMLRDRIAALGLPELPASSITSLAALSEGYPLAIEIISPLLEVLPVERLLQGADLLSTSLERPDLPPRHRSLRAAVAASLAALPRYDRAAVVQLSVFCGSFSLQEAAAVVELPSDADLVDILSTLRRRSLLRRSEVGALSVYPHLRAALCADLDAGPLGEAVRERHARWLLSKVRAVSEGREEMSAIAPLRADLIEAMLRGPASDTPSLGDALLNISGHYGPIEPLPGLFRALLARELPDRAKARAMKLLAEAHRMRAEPEESERAARAALVFCDQIGAEDESIRCLIELCWATSQLGRDEESISLAQDAAARAEKARDLNALYMALEFLGSAYAEQCKPDLARSQHLRAAEIARERGKRNHIAISTMNAANNTRDPDQAVAMIREALAITADSYPRFEGVALGNLAHRLLDTGDRKGASESFRRSIERLEAAGDTTLAASMRLRQAGLTASEGRKREAIAAVRSVVEVLRDRRPRDATRGEVYLAALTRDRVQLAALSEGDELAAVALALLDGQPTERLPERMVREMRLLIEA